MFGTPATKLLFLLKDGFTNLNHGSFGATPKEVIRTQNEFVLEAESHPDHWFRSRYFEHINVSRKRVAELILASDIDDIVLVENASAAINDILRSLPLKKGDKVLRLSTAYDMCSEVLKWLEHTIGIEQVVVDVIFPYTGPSRLLEDVERAMNQHGATIKVALFSHISSMPTLIEPIHELTKICKHTGNNFDGSCIVLIDGAHAPGVLPIDVESIGCDFYTGNLHKWTFTPKGCAFLWTKKHNGFQAEVSGIQPGVISSRGMPSYIDRYAYTGTRDYTAFATIPAAFDFAADNLGGFPAIYEYNHALVLAGAEYCAQSWGTSTLVTDHSSVGVMMDVLLPSTAQNESTLRLIQERMDSEHNTYFVFKKMIFDSETKWFVRLSAQVYLTLDDFIKFAELLLTLSKTLSR